MDKRLKILQQQFNYDLQLLESLEGQFKERLLEDMNNLQFEIENLKRSTQLQEQNVGSN